MARAWLIDGRTIARKLKDPNPTSAHQIKDYGANRECPNCHHRIDNSDVSQDWPGLPAGVKFGPSDVELLEHLAAKCGVADSKPHPLIDEFVPTVVEDKGICYTHPENLPGAKKDGSSFHFFHRTTNAYATGQRKRRRIHNEHGSKDEHVRWHKTGKTKPVMENGVQKGCKKIMVLYKSSKKGTKPDKSNWVMHQCHLGTDEDEKKGEYVVSRIFYQQHKQTDSNNSVPVLEESDILALQTSPRTPNPNPPDPPFSAGDDGSEDNRLQSPVQELEIVKREPDVSVPAAQPQDDDEVYPAWLAGESQAAENIDLSGFDDASSFKEIFNSSIFLNSGLNNASYSGMSDAANGVTGNNHVGCGISDLANLELDTPSDLALGDLQISSQDNILSWIDRL